MNLFLYTNTHRHTYTVCAKIPFGVKSPNWQLFPSLRAGTSGNKNHKRKRTHLQGRLKYDIIVSIVWNQCDQLSGCFSSWLLHI